jgi:hypothetical protein
MVVDGHADGSRRNESVACGSAFFELRRDDGLVV